MAARLSLSFVGVAGTGGPPLVSGWAWFAKAADRPPLEGYWPLRGDWPGPCRAVVSPGKGSLCGFLGGGVLVEDDLFDFAGFVSPFHELGEVGVVDLSCATP